MKEYYQVEVQIGQYWSRHAMRWPGIHHARKRVRELKAMGIMSRIARIVKITEEIVE